MLKTITHKRLLFVASVVIFTAVSLLLVGNSDAWAQSGSKTRSTQSSSGTTTHHRFKAVLRWRAIVPCASSI